MYEGEPVATEEQYYQQAETIDDKGAETQDEDWLPLGVFAIIDEVPALVHFDANRREPRTLIRLKNPEE